MRTWWRLYRDLVWLLLLTVVINGLWVYFVWLKP